MKYLNEALVIDEKCEIAHAHIAQLYIQIGKLPKAIEHYNLGLFLYLFFIFEILFF